MIVNITTQKQSCKLYKKTVVELAASRFFSEHLDVFTMFFNQGKNSLGISAASMLFYARIHKEYNRFSGIF